MSTPTPKIRQLGRMPIEAAFELVTSGKIDYQSHDEGYNLLHWTALTACRIGRLPFDQNLRFSYLFDYDVDVNQKDMKAEYNNTPLHLLIANETIDTAIFFIDEAFRKDKPLDLNITDSEGKTPLLFATKTNKHLLSLHILKQRAHSHVDVSRADRDGMTPLHFACAYGALEVVKALVKAGADIEVKDSKGKRPLDYTILGAEKIREFFKSVSIDCSRDEFADMDVIRDMNSSRPYSATSITMLTIPSVLSSKELVKKMLREGILDTLGLLMEPRRIPLEILTNPRAIAFISDQVDRMSGRSLLASCLAGQVHTREWMIDHGANFSGLIRHLSTTPNIAEMQHLLAKPTSAMYIDIPGGSVSRTALHNAVLWGNIEMCECLLKAGANIYARDKDGNTALHLALTEHKIDIAMFLKKSQDDFTIKNQAGLSVLDLLEERQYSPIKTLLFPKIREVSIARTAPDPLEILQQARMEFRARRLALEKPAEPVVTSSSNFSFLSRLSRHKTCTAAIVAVTAAVTAVAICNLTSDESYLPTPNL